MTDQNEVKAKTNVGAEVLDDTNKYIIRGGHVYVKTEQLLQSPRVKQQIEKIREIFKADVN